MNRPNQTYCQAISNATFSGTFAGFVFTDEEKASGFLDSKAQRKCLFSGFVFTGKERDEETGYGYFGARYMDHELTTMWLSVDPMADKYPSISPYAYCAWNPIKLVDPNGDTISMSREAWLVQKQAFLSVFDNKKENIPFAYDEATSQMYYIGGNDSHQYSEAQNTIIDNYKSLCESKYHAKVHVVDNNQEIMTTKGSTTLYKGFSTGMTVDHGNNTADIYISSHPLYKLNGKIMRHPQKEDYQSIAILHEIGGHAFNYSHGITGDLNRSNTTDFENLCRSIFRGKYGSQEIRKGKSSEKH